MVFYFVHLEYGFWKCRCHVENIHFPAFRILAGCKAESLNSFSSRFNMHRHETPNIAWVWAPNQKFSVSTGFGKREKEWKMASNLLRSEAYTFRWWWIALLKVLHKKILHPVLAKFPLMDMCENASSENDSRDDRNTARVVLLTVPSIESFDLHLDSSHVFFPCSCKGLWVRIALIFLAESLCP